MIEYKESKLIYYKLENNYLKEYMLYVDIEELLASDIYLDLKDYPKYSSKENILKDIRSNDKKFFSIDVDLETVNRTRLNEFSERYDVINLKYIPLPIYEGQIEELYEIEYKEIKYISLWTLIIGIINNITSIEKIDYINNYELYIHKIDTINQIIENFKKILEEDPNPTIRRQCNRIKNCFDIRLIRKIDLNNKEEVENFFNKENKKTLILKQKPSK